MKNQFNLPSASSVSMGKMKMFSLKLNKFMGHFSSNWETQKWIFCSNL